jgi:flavin-dependent dehydrogenase
VAERYDVIITGARPAGGMAAFFLGQAGMGVLLLEREKIPGYKACGGGVSIEFLKQQSNSCMYQPCSAE